MSYRIAVRSQDGQKDTSAESKVRVLALVPHPKVSLLHLVSQQLLEY